MTHSTFNAQDNAHFATLADAWWSPDGALRTLHAFNPVRVAFIKQAVRQVLGQAAVGATPFAGLSVLDVGCGGGILSEALAQAGAQVVGLDTSAEGIAAAQKHAKQSKLKITYRHTALEAYKPKNLFDVVVLSEVIEHVADVPLCLEHAARVLKPQGLLVVTTPNRTIKSLLLGVGVAEYVLGLVPRGTHHWQQFLKPSELVAQLSAVGLETVKMAGATYNPLTGTAQLSSTDLAINYLLAAKKL